MDRHARLIAIAKALRGEGWPLSWNEVSAPRRRPWLELAGVALDAIEQQESQMKTLFISEWRRCWRLFSVQIHALFGLWLALFEIMPTLSPQIAAVLPDPLQAKIMAVYAILGVISRVVAQRGK